MKKPTASLPVELNPTWTAILGMILFYFLYSIFVFSLTSVSLSGIYVGLVFLAAIEGICCCIFRNIFLATATADIISFSIYYIDFFVYSARLTHIRFSDLSVAGDGLAVMSHYSFPWNFQVFLRLALLVTVIVLQIVITRSCKHKPRKWGIFALGCGLVAVPALILAVCMMLNLYSTNTTTDDMFDSNGYFENHGLFCTLFNQWQNSRIVEPEGYSTELAEEILSRYADIFGASSDVDIVVIMNEAFADYSLIGDILYQDPLGNIHNQYGDELFEGQLIVSVRGGTTCNTEYEFLTGNSLSFLPNACIPFSQYIRPGQMSLATDLNSLSYFTEGIHPYYSQEWNRKQNYGYLGFSKSIFGEDFSSQSFDTDIPNITDTHLGTLDFGNELEYLRGFISDRECYKKIRSELETAEKNCFIFAVTIQNHGAYNYDGLDFVSEVFVDNADVNQYLTCTMLSDEAFRELTDYLSQRDRKTLVLMFGDHQPGLDMQSYVNFYSSSSLINEYTVPYIFWSNYGVNFDCPDVVSANYLSALLKKQAGIKLTAWDSFRLSVMQEYPMLYKDLAYNAENGLCVINDCENSLLSQYQVLTYYNQFD